MPTSRDIEIEFAADAMIERYGCRAALEAAAWANDAYERGEIAKYEFWQWVCMDIQHRRHLAQKIKKVKH